METVDIKKSSLVVENVLNGDLLFHRQNLATHLYSQGPENTIDKLVYQN
jgi:hypothetical protein